MIGKHKAGLNHLAILFLLLIAFCSSCSEANRDKEIKADLTVKAKGQLDLAAVSYTVQDGIVTLTGKCSTEKSKNGAEQVVKDINIVRGIVNKIVIAPVLINDDAMLKQTVDSVLKDYPMVKADISENTIVLEGKAGKQDVTKMLPALNKLHPAKIENKMLLE